MVISGLFSGIGGFELGFQRAGHRTVLLCENDRYASLVLRRRFADVCVEGDIRNLDNLPIETEVVTAGFPCQNLSMAGNKEGLEGEKSSIIDCLFRLLDRHRAPWVVIENVCFMLYLKRGMAIASIVDELEDREYRWAYRVVDSRAFGLPQRRRRVFIVACLTSDPRRVLFADDALCRAWPAPDLARPVGFYWTEGRSGNGLTADAVPPLKAGSTLNIPCPPAVFLPSGRVVTPTIEAVERFQGFPSGWTLSLRAQRAERHRWRLVGNAVSVPVAEWIGRRLDHLGTYDARNDSKLKENERWPKAAWNMGDGRMSAVVSEYPVYRRRGRLSAFATDKWPELSTRALRGFVTRARNGTLRYPQGFLDELEKELRRRSVQHSQ